MAAGRFEADILHTAAAIGAALAGKVKEVAAANPYDEVAKPAPTPEQERKESRRAMRLLGMGLKTLAKG